jgi:hypothetical protein
VRAPTSFHPNQTRFEPRQKREHLLAGKLFSQHHRSPGIDPAKTKDALCQIDTEHRNFHVGLSSLLLADGQMYHPARSFGPLKNEAGSIPLDKSFMNGWQGPYHFQDYLS